MCIRDSIIDIDETYISRKHTAIFVETQQYLVVKDLDSSGGTYVNGIQITEKRLINGDTITFGGNLNTYKLVVEFVDPNQTYRTEWIQQPAETDVPEGMVVQSQTSDYTSDIAVLLAAKDEDVYKRQVTSWVSKPKLRSLAAMSVASFLGFLSRPCCSYWLLPINKATRFSLAANVKLPLSSAIFSPRICACVPTHRHKRR